MTKPISVEFRGCADHHSCDCALFSVSAPHEQTVEVWTTDQIESILARELGKHDLSARDREAILTIAGGRLIHECLESHGHIDSPLFLTSDFLFRRPGMERQLLHDAGLLPG